MILNDKTRLVICEDRPAFFSALMHANEHLAFYCKDLNHTPALREHMEEVRHGLHVDLAAIANRYDPSLKVLVDNIVNVTVYHTLTYAVLQFLYKAEDGSPTNVAIRMDEIHALA